MLSQLIRLRERVELAPFGDDARDHLLVLVVVPHLLRSHGHEQMFVQTLRKLIEDLLLPSPQKDRGQRAADRIEFLVPNDTA